MDAAFEIDGNTYAIPELDTFDMDEAEILFDYSGCVLEDFAPADPDAPEEEQEQHVQGQLAKVRNPRFKRALVHVAYRRAHPDLADAEVRAATGKANMLDVTINLFRGDADPQNSSQKQPERKTGISQPGSPVTSGSISPDGSEAPASLPESIGTGGSDTSVPRLVRTGSDS